MVENMRGTYQKKLHEMIETELMSYDVKFSNGNSVIIDMNTDGLLKIDDILIYYGGSSGNVQFDGNRAMPSDDSLMIVEESQKYKLKQGTKQLCVSHNFKDVIKKLISEIKGKKEIEFYRKESDDQKKVKELINNDIKQIILTGAPGTGKTYTAKRVAREIVKEKLKSLKKLESNKKQWENFIQIVQFHPSYDYTDFVEGLRPVQIEGDNQLTFQKVDGIFKAFCRNVVNDNKAKNTQAEKIPYFFIIDEINRADLSKVFGELMYCLEKDKRGENNAIKTQYQNLKTFDLKNGKMMEADDFESDFYIPENVYIIGTMNDIDRSVESMDFALRRRFMFVEFKVTKESLKQAFEIGEFNPIINGAAQDIAERVNALNQQILKAGKQYSLSEDYFISQGQFVDIPSKCEGYNLEEKDGILAFIWEMRIEPLLKEYLRGEGNISNFLKDCKEKFCPSSAPQNSSKTSEPDDTRKD